MTSTISHVIRRTEIAALWALIVLSMLAVLAINRIERRGSPVGRPTVTAVFSPNGDGVSDEALLTFDIRHGKGYGAMIVDASDHEVRNLRRDGDAHGRVQLGWDGRDGHGNVVDEGTYRLKLRATAAGRSILVPSPIVVDVTPPRIRSMSIDTSRLTSNSVLRVTLSVEGAVRTDIERIEEAGGPIALPIVRLRREGRRGSKHWQTHMRMSVRLPEGLPWSLGSLHVVAADAAGNTVVRRIVSPVPTVGGARG